MDIFIDMNVFFFKTKFGRSPVREFIDEQPLEDQARFLNILDEIERFGFAAVRIIFKPIEGKLWEVKFRSAGGGYRILYVLLNKETMVWLHAFKKKTQKTPTNDLKIARSRMKEVL